MSYYLDRGQAAEAAKRKGVEHFHTHSFPVPGGRGWKFHPMPAASPALEWARGRDYVHHVETDFIDEGRQPGYRGLVIVTCFVHEIPDEDKAEAEGLGFVFEPITPSLWDGDRGSVKKTRHGEEMPRQRAKSDVASPSKLVWEKASEMQSATRDEVVQACVALGVNKATAQTQYYRWAKAQKK